MASKENLRLRVMLIGKFDGLAARLDAGDESAIEEAHSHLAGLLVCRDMGTLALIMRALAKVLDEFQPEIDAKGLHW